MRQGLAVVVITLFIAPFAACQQSETSIADKLDVAAFEAGYTGNGKAQLIDVRTPEEFAKGHLHGAVNIDWNGKDFTEQTALLDRSRPVYIYCLSGGRSANAARALAGNGFSEVHDMKGGYMAWTGSGRVVDGAKSGARGMTMAQFDALLASDMPVVVDFYAPWCAPCKKMMPMWDDLKANNPTELKVVTIDSDTHHDLSKQMGINEIPTIIIMKGGKEVWRHVGLIEKADLVKAVASN